MLSPNWNKFRVDQIWKNEAGQHIKIIDCDEHQVTEQLMIWFEPTLGRIITWPRSQSNDWIQRWTIFQDIEPDKPRKPTRLELVEFREDPK